MNVTRKVRYGTAVTVGTGLVTWLLVTYVFHGSLPPDLATALPVIIASVLGAVTAWWTKHAPQDLRIGVANLAVDVKDLTEQLQKIQTGSLPNSLPATGGTVPRDGSYIVGERGNIPPASEPRVAVGAEPWAKFAAPLKTYATPSHPVVDIVQPPLKVHEPTTTLTGTAFTAEGPIATGAGSTLAGKNVFEGVPMEPVLPVPASDIDGPPKVNQQAALGLDPYGVK